MMGELGPVVEVDAVVGFEDGLIGPVQCKRVVDSDCFARIDVFRDYFGAVVFDDFDNDCFVFVPELLAFVGCDAHCRIVVGSRLVDRSVLLRTPTGCDTGLLRGLSNLRLHIDRNYAFVPIVRDLDVIADLGCCWESVFLNGDSQRLTVIDEDP